MSGSYGNLFFISSKIEELTIKYDEKDDLKVNHTSFYGDNAINKVSLESFSCNSTIYFHGGIYQTISFEGRFNKNISFDEEIICTDLFLESSTFYGRVDFIKGKFKQIYIYRSNFQKLLVFRGYDYLDKTPLDLSVCKISLHACQFEDNISISIIDLEWLDLSNNNFKQVLNVNSYFQYHHTDTCTHISLQGLNQGNIIIDDILADLRLSDLNYGNIHFRNLNIRTIDFNEFHNQGSVSFTKLDNFGWLIINKSIVGNLNFFNTDLHKFEEIVISDSNINGLKISQYPKKVRSYSAYNNLGYGLEDKSRNHQNLKSVYNQLKQIAKGNGDIDAFSRYQALEYKELLLTKRISFDTILLTLNWLSNNNGNSWLRGILFTLGIAFLFFLLYMKQLGQPLFTPEAYKDYILYIGSFPKMKIEDFNHLNGIWNITLIIWLSKIFISYGIYQTISAFRKYGKK